MQSSNTGSTMATTTTARTHLPFPKKTRIGLRSPTKLPISPQKKKEVVLAEKIYRENHIIRPPKKDDMNARRIIHPPITTTASPLTTNAINAIIINNAAPTLQVPILQPKINPPAPIKMVKTPTKNPASSTAKTPVLAKYIHCYKSDKTAGTTVNKSYVKHSLLGKGGFARVYKFLDTETQSYYASKVIPKENILNERSKQKLMNEIRLHKSLRHKYICYFENCYEDKLNVYLIMELCENKSMMSLMNSRTRITEEETRYFMQQILSAVSFMHRHNVIHRDLKLGNLFLNKNMEIKIGDFGLAARLKSATDRRKTICGTPNYIAPEVLSGKETTGHSFEVDIWSLGVILYTLLIGKPPFETEDVKSTYKKIKANDYTFPTNMTISEHAKDLIRSILNPIPEKRLKIDQILSHPFFFSGYTPRSLPPTAFHTLPKFPQSTSLSENQVNRMMSSTSTTSKPPLELQVPIAPSIAIPVPISLVTDENEKMDTNEKENIQVNQNVILEVQNNGGGNSNRKRNRTPTTPTKDTDAGAALKPLTERSPASRKLKITTQDPAGSATSSRAVPRSLVIQDQEEERAEEERGENKEEDEPEQEKEGDKQDEEPQIEKVESFESVYRNLVKNFEDLTLGRRGEDTKPRPQSKVFGPSVWVQSYEDFSVRYGLAYQLQYDSGVGAFFNDDTKIIWPSPTKSNEFYYIERQNGRECKNWHRLDNYPTELTKKVKLLTYFTRRFAETEERGSSERLCFTLASADAVRGVRENKSVFPRPDPVIYVSKWIIGTSAAVFHLSNQVVQVNFSKDGTKLFLSEQGNVVTFMDKDGRTLTSELRDVMMYPVPAVMERLRYTRDLLNTLLREK